MTIPRNQIPYVTMKKAPMAIRVCFGSYAKAAAATGYTAGQLLRWANRGSMPRPVYDRLAKASPTQFPRYGRVKWIRGGRNWIGPDSVGEPSDTQRKGRRKRITAVRPKLVSQTTATSLTEIPDALTALQQLIGDMKQIRDENERLKAKLSSLRDALV